MKQRASILKMRLESTLGLFFFSFFMPNSLVNLTATMLIYLYPAKTFFFFKTRFICGTFNLFVKVRYTAYPVTVDPQQQEAWYSMASTPGQNVHLVLPHNHVVVSSPNLANSSSQLVLSSSLSQSVVGSFTVSGQRVVKYSIKIVSILRPLDYVFASPTENVKSRLVPTCLDYSFQKRDTLN